MLKHTGDYQMAGEVRAVFTPFEHGPYRYVVAHKADRGIILHIYSEANIMAVV